MSICLNMIVKDEAEVILRCLASVFPLIDYWVIVDTGSADHTPKLIETFFKERNIPGELHKRPWKDFSTNRNQALELAKEKGDYILFIDADEQLLYKEGFSLPPLTLDSYLILCDNDSILYYRRLLVKSTLPWRWEGVLHETIEGKEPFTTDILPLVTNLVSAGGGARFKDKTTRQKDAALLEKALKNDPENKRALFYLALTYMMLDQNESALKMFKRRIHLDDHTEEVYLSLLQMAIIKENIKKHPDVVFKAYSKAIKARPNRKEAYFYMARFLRRIHKLQAAYETAKKGMELPETKDLIGVESKVYHHQMAFEFSVIALGLGKAAEGKEVALSLLEKENLPEETRLLIEQIWTPLKHQGKKEETT